MKKQPLIIFLVMLLSSTYSFSNNVALHTHNVAKVLSSPYSKDDNKAMAINDRIKRRALKHHYYSSTKSVSKPRERSVKNPTKVGKTVLGELIDIIFILVK